jgi:VNT family MFS transporter (synaptic vesicle glycoprotein 2)
MIELRTGTAEGYISKVEPLSLSTESEVMREVVPRTLDVFLEDAYEDKTNGIKWQYWMVMLSLGVANSSDASEILCLSYILSDAQFQVSMLQNEAWKAEMLASAVFFGMLVGGLIVGVFGDWWGRHPMLMVGLVCNSIAGILSAFAQNVWQLSILRCIAGLGIGATVPPLFTLVTELSPPSKRGAFITFVASFWMVGSIFVAVAALFIMEYCQLSWRVFTVACAVPSAIGFFMVGSLVPASPRFLAINQRQDEALRGANKLALQMRYSGDIYTNEEMLYNYPSAPPQEERFAHITNTNTCVWLWKIIGVGFSDFMRSTSKVYELSLRQTTWPLQVIWFSLNFGTYGILTWINSLFVAVHLENVYFNALLFAASNLPGNLLSGFLMDRTGRTCMLVTTSLGAAASLMSFAYFAAQESSDSESLNESGIVISACVFQAFSIAAWNTIDCLTTERFPTSVRSTGMGLCAASGRVGAMLAQIINGALVGNPVRLLLVASTSLVIAAFTPFLLPTGDFANRPLEDDVDSKCSDEDDEMVRLNQIKMNGPPEGQQPYLRVRGYQQGGGVEVNNKTIV